MEVHIEREAKTLTEEFAGTAIELLRELNINPETVLVIKDGTLVTEDESLTGATGVEILSVISGG